MVQDQGRRFGVVDDALDLGTGESRIQGDGLEAALVARQLPAQHVDVVGQRVGEDVAGTEPVGAQRVDEAVGPSGQLRKAERDPGRTADHGRLIWIFFRQPPESEPPIPRVFHENRVYQ